MKKLILLTLSLLSITTASHAQGLKDIVGRHCLVGAALNQWQSAGKMAIVDTIVNRHFNSAVAENCMKSEQLQPAEGVFDFRQADLFVDYCEQHHLTPIGHCLVWHSQAPAWLFAGQPSREQLIRRIENHIRTVVGRYRGRIHGWDVVNEAIEDDGSMRRSPLYDIIGEDFIEIAFRAAHEADPDAELYYNDYSMAIPAKREAVCRLIRNLKSKGIRIDGVGMQSHVGLDSPDLVEYERSIDSFAAENVKVMITELDMNVLPNPWQFGGAAVEQNFEYQQKLNPYTEQLPAAKAREAEKRYMDFFQLFYKHRQQISRITFWGISDADSWLNNWPINGRTNYPLPFDRQYNEKPLVKKIIDLYNH
jgi:endo-1,4-beta-xylanase